MKHTIKSLVLFFIFIVPTFSFAMGITTDEQKKAVEIQKAVFSRQYSKALKTLEQIAPREFSPLPSLVRMAIVEFKMSENLAFHHRGRFIDHSGVNEGVCERIQDDPNTSAWDLMLCGAGHGMRAFFYLKSNQAMRGMGYAKKAIKLLDMAKKKDPGNVDVDLGQGLYDFFKSHFMKTKMSFVPFVPDRRDSAIAMIQNVANNGVYAKDFANMALVLIALDTSRKNIGLVALNKLIKKYPGNVLFKIMNAAFLITFKDYNTAKSLLLRMEKSYPRTTVVKYFLGRVLVLEGKDLDTAEQYFQEFLKTKPDRSIKGGAYYHLGLIYEKKGNIDEAIKYFKLGYDTFPEYKASLKNLLRLKRARDASK